MSAPNEARGPLFWLGAAGLLIATATDTLAVIGRHIGVPLLGSVEIVEAAVVLATSAAMVTATLRGSHAVVHLVVDRLPPRFAAPMQRIANLLSAGFFAAAAIGNGWFAADMWHAHEQSDLIHIPYRPLHVLVTLACATIAAISLWRTFAPRRAA